MSGPPVSLVKRPAAPDDRPDSSKRGHEPEQELDALRLLRRVYLRRVLRALCGIEVLAIAVWAAYSLSLEAYYDPGSSNWERIDDETGPGFVVILVALAVTLIAFVTAGAAGATGRTARTIVRIGGSTPDIAVRPNTSAAAFQARLRRRGFVQPAAVGLLLLFGLLAVMTGAGMWPALLANHGHGGRVFAIDSDTSVSVDQTGRRATYFVGTPEGTAVAESGHPRDGQQWTVVRDLFGNLQAYRVGGFDYLLVGVLFLISAVVVLGAIAWQVEAVVTERRHRRRHGDRDLAADVATLAAGARARLLVAGQQVGVLVLPSSTGRDPARLLRIRRISSGGGGTLVAVAVVALVVLQQFALLAAPPDHRDVTLPYLRAAGWNPKAYVSYTNNTADTRQLREWAGADHEQVTQVRDVQLDRLHDYPPGSYSTPMATVTIARIGSVPSATITAGWNAHLAELARIYGGHPVDAVSGLPPGWQGHYLRESDELTELHALRVTAATSIEIELNDSYYADGADRHYPHSLLDRWVGDFARAVDTAGVTRLEQDTVRPAHA